jgi:DNA repair protein RadC
MLLIMPKSSSSNKPKIKKSEKLTEVTLVYKSKIKPTQRQSISSSVDAALFLKKVWSEQMEIQEEFLIMGLDSSNKVLGWMKLTSGDIESTIFTPRMIFQVALSMNAVGIIISHNHTSGDIEPSEADIEATRKVVRVGQEMNVRILDHIIIGPEDKYFSFADGGLIKDPAQYSTE